MANDDLNRLEVVWQINEPMKRLAGQLCDDQAAITKWSTNASQPVEFI